MDWYYLAKNKKHDFWVRRLTLGEKINFGNHGNNKIFYSNRREGKGWKNYAKISI